MSHLTNPDEELLRRAAHRETFRNVAHQLECLKRRYNVLYGVTADTASRSNQANQVSMQQQPNSRAFILRKLKYALRTQYEACFPLPPMDRCTVLLLFDSNEEAFFEIRLNPKAWPEDWPTRLDCGSAGIDVELYSGAIYMKVLEALREEEAENGGMGVLSEPPRAFGVVNSSGTGARPQSSVVEENGLARVIVKSEEEEVVIGGNQLSFSDTIKEEPTEDSSSLTIRRKRPPKSTSNSEALKNDPLPLPPPPSAATARAPRTMARGFALRRVRASRGSRALASAAVSTSARLQNGRLRSSAEMTAAANRFYASSAYLEPRTHDYLNCPLCEKQIMKQDLTDHINAVHLQRRRYHCAWPGCAKVFGYQSSGRNHLREVHQSTAYGQYLLRRD